MLLAQLACALLEESGVVLGQGLVCAGVEGGALCGVSVAEDEDVLVGLPQLPAVGELLSRSDGEARG